MVHPDVKLHPALHQNSLAFPPTLVATVCHRFSAFRSQTFLPPDSLLPMKKEGSAEYYNFVGLQNLPELADLANIWYCAKFSHCEHHVPVNVGAPPSTHNYWASSPQTASLTHHTLLSTLPSNFKGLALSIYSSEGSRCSGTCRASIDMDNKTKVSKLFKHIIIKLWNNFTHSTAKSAESPHMSIVLLYFRYGYCHFHATTTLK